MDDGGQDNTPTQEAFNRPMWHVLWRVALEEYRDGHRARLVELLRNESNPPRAVLIVLAELVEKAPRSKKPPRLTLLQRRVVRALKAKLEEVTPDSVENERRRDIHAALFSEQPRPELRRLRAKVLRDFSLPDVPAGTLRDYTKRTKRR